MGPEADGDLESIEAVLAEVAVRDADWRLGNYQILEEVGRGGMGVIYRARQRHSRRIVALKRVLSHHGDSRETLERFRREAEAAASLDHPNILPIYEVGEADGFPFFTMKFATGGSLQEAAAVLRAQPRECVRLLAKVSHAVAYAHRGGILHRDLKPGNILLDARGEPMVSDFGLAKWLDASSDLTRSLAIFGTPGFIAPEQAHGPSAALTPAADVYSLGAILFDLLAGRPPFLGEHAIAVLRQAAENSAPKLRSLDRSLGKDLENICAKCLERDPAARYRSAGDLAEDLDRWLEGRPIIARPVPALVRGWRWSKRNPLVSLSLLAAISAGAIGLTRQLETRRLAVTAREMQAAERSLSLLPFLDLDTAASDYGLTETLAQSLRIGFSKLGPSRVTAVGSHDGSASAEARPTSRSSGTHFSLVGTTRKVGGKNRISLRLLDSGNGNSLYQTTLDIRPQDSLAPAIARATQGVLYTHLASQTPPELESAQLDPSSLNQDARDFVAAGRELLKTRSVIGLNRAAESFRRATEAEPASALAYALLATAQAATTQIEPVPGLIQKAERSARKAVELNPRLGEAHRALANVLFAKEDYGSSAEELFQSIELDGPKPGSAARLAGILRALGRPDRALGWCELSKAQAFPADVDNLIGDCWADLGADERAEAAYRRVSQFRPELPDGWIGVCRLRLLQQDFAGAQDLAKKQLDSYGDYGLSVQMAAQVQFFSGNYLRAEELYRSLAAAQPKGGTSGYGGLSYPSVLGTLRMVAGDLATGQRVLREALQDEKVVLETSPHSAQTLYTIAAISAALDDADQALLHLTGAISEGWIDYRSTQIDPRFDNVSKDPRFLSIITELAKKMESLRQSAVSKTNNPESK